MKKLFTSILSLSLAMGAIAGQQTTAGTLQRTSKAPHLPVLNQPSQAKAPVLGGETVDLFFTTSTYTFEYYAETGDWYLGVTDDSDNYIVRLDYITSEDGQYGSYTYADLDTIYSYISENVAGARVDHQLLPGSAFTVEEEDSCFVLTGTLYANDGKTYNLHGRCPLPEPPVYDIEGQLFTMLSYDPEAQDWYIRFRSDDYKVTLDLLSPDGTFSGTYTENDAAGSNYVTDLQEDEDDNFSTFTVSLSMPEGVTDPDVACEITGTARSRKAVYNFHMLKDLPVQAKDTVTVEATLTTSEWPSERVYGGGYYELTETASPEQQWKLGFQTLTGESNEETIDQDLTARTNTQTGEQLTVLHGTYSQAIDAQTMTLAVKAELVMSDSIQYNLAFDVPLQVNGQVTYDFTTLELDDSYIDYGQQTLEAENDDVNMNVNIYDYSTVPGDYTDGNCNIVLNIFGAEPKSVSSLAIIQASSVLADDNTPVFTAKFLGDDMTVYTINAKFEVPAIADTLDITAEGMTVKDYLEYGNNFDVYGAVDDTRYLYMSINGSEIAGHFTGADLSRGSRLSTTDEFGNEHALKFYNADFDVTKEKRDVTLKGTFQIGSHFVRMTLTGTIEVEGAIDGDNDEVGVEAIFSASDLYDVFAYSENMMAMVELVNAERQEELALEFILEQFDDETSIPEGEYEISEYGWAPSVMAGSSMDGEYYLSYYAKLDEGGYIQAPLWFLKSGTVTVYKIDGALAFEVNALNSYGQTVHVLYNMTPDAISHVSVEPVQAAPARKVMQGNKVVIVKGNHRYSIFGQELK